MLYNYKGTKIEASSKEEAIVKIISEKELSDKEIFDAAEKGDKSILKLPKERLTIKNNDGDTPVHILAYNGVKEILKVDKSLLTIKNKYGNTPIHILDLYERFGNQRISPELKKYIGSLDKSNKDTHGDTPMHHLVKMGLR